MAVARGEREAHDRGAVGRGAALELLREEAAAVAVQPVDERGAVEFALEGDLGQAEDLLGGAAAHDHVPEEEVLQDVGADGVLALLQQLALVADGQQLRRDRSKRQRPLLTRDPAGRRLPAAQAQQVTEIATGVRRESIESALDAIEEKYPSFEEYLRAEFEIGAAELEDIRARYLV